MNDILNISMIIVLWGTFAVLLLNYINNVKNSCSHEREKYKSCKEALEDMKQLLETTKKEYKKKLAEYTELNKMAIELSNAVRAGAVKLYCPEHKVEVQVLVDGTIVCPKGHRVWPRDEEE